MSATTAEPPTLTPDSPLIESPVVTEAGLWEITQTVAPDKETTLLFRNTKPDLSGESVLLTFDETAGSVTIGYQEVNDKVPTRTLQIVTTKEGRASVTNLDETLTPDDVNDELRHVQALIKDPDIAQSGAIPQNLAAKLTSALDQLIPLSSD